MAVVFINGSMDWVNKMAYQQRFGSFLSVMRVFLAQVLASDRGKLFMWQA